MRPIVSIGRVDSLKHTRRLALACVLVSGCLDEATPTPPQAMTAREQFMQHAWPALAACQSCHGSQPAIDFLAPGTADGAYTTLFEFQPPVIDVSAPASSLLVTMGKHTGPALDPASASRVLQWLEAERDERVPGVGTSATVGPFLPALGTAMTLDLPAGGTVTMMAEAGEAGLYLSRLTVKAGSALHVVHPLFVSRPPKPILDDLDRFSDLDVSLAAGETVELGPAAFLSFNPSDYLTIHFKTLEAP